MAVYSVLPQVMSPQHYGFLPGRGTEKAPLHLESVCLAGGWDDSHDDAGALF